MITSENNGTELWGGKFTDAARTALALGDDYVVKGDATIFFQKLTRTHETDIVAGDILEQLVDPQKIYIDFER